MNKKIYLLMVLLTFAIKVEAGVATGAAAVDYSASTAKQSQAADDFKKPDWLGEVSVSVKVSYDSNVFLTNADRVGFPKMANVASWVTVLTPKIGVDFKPLLGLGKDDTSVQALAFSYAPDIVRYHEAATENYENHRFIAQIKGVADSFSYTLDSQSCLINGNRNTPQYNQVSAWATAVVRERRDQFQEKGKLQLRNDWDSWFVRGVASTVYYDLNTEQYNPVGQHAGWQNYVDRYDANGGVDAGYKISRDFAATLGYRRGYQYQSAFSWNTASNSNEYNRVLIGFEGRPCAWLKMDMQAGPDFHEYDVSQMQAGHAAAVTSFFADGKMTAEWTRNDALSCSIKQWQWVSSTGACTYEDKTFDFSYKHKFSSEWNAVLGYTIQGAVYNAPTVRSDWQYTYSAGLRYECNEHFSISADYAYSRGENESEISNLAPGREYDRHLVSLGLKAAF